MHRQIHRRNTTRFRGIKHKEKGNFMSTANKQKRAFKAQTLNMDKPMRQNTDDLRTPGSEENELTMLDHDTLDKNKACSLIREFRQTEAMELNGQMPDSIIEKLEFTLVIRHGTQKHVQHQIQHLEGQAMPMQIKSPKNDPSNPTQVCVYLTKKQFLKLRQYWEQGKECPGLL